jgi:hypothetical protein
MNWKDLEGSGRVIILRHYSGILLVGPRNTTKNLSLDSQSLGHDLNPGPPEYECRP